MANLPGAAGGGGSSTKRKSASGQTYSNRQPYVDRNPPRSAAATRKLSKSSATAAPRYKSSSVKATSTGQYGAVPSVPQEAPGNINDINAYLGGDSAYQDGLRQLAKALSDFGADVGRRRGDLESEFGTSKRALGDQRTLDLKGLEEDFAARGIGRSGLYAGAVGDYEKEYGERVSDLDRRQQQALQQLLQEESQYGQQNELEKQALREAAIKRRAETYGV